MPPSTNETALNILLPQIWRFENDSRGIINFNTALSGYPLAVSSAYGKGTFCVLGIPDDFADLYRLPRNAQNQIRTLLGRDLFVRLDAPDHLALFAYDNRTFIIQNFRPEPETARVSVTRASSLHDLLSGQTLMSQPAGADQSGHVQTGNGAPWFNVPVPAHSFRVFAADTLSQ